MKLQLEKIVLISALELGFLVYSAQYPLSQLFVNRGSSGPWIVLLFILIGIISIANVLASRWK